MARCVRGNASMLAGPTLTTTYAADGAAVPTVVPDRSAANRFPAALPQLEAILRPYVFAADRPPSALLFPSHTPPAVPNSRGDRGCSPPNGAVTAWSHAPHDDAMRLALLLLLLAACSTEPVSRGEALNACDVARPAYGNSLAACLVVLEKWKASDALTANDWHGREAALDTAHNAHALRAYLARSRQTLSVLLHVDSGWIERRLHWDSTVAAVFDSMEHATVATGIRRRANRLACYRPYDVDLQHVPSSWIVGCDSINP
jgi:hypothetical protein